MAKAFNFEVFYDFIEILHELKPYLSGESGISPFNYLDAYAFVRRCVDDEDRGTAALNQLHEALFSPPSSNTFLQNISKARAKIMRADMMAFIDTLDEWRLDISRFYGLSPVINHAYAFTILCEMYCDEDEPAYSAIYSQKRNSLELAIPPRQKQQIRRSIQDIRKHHFSRPIEGEMKSTHAIDQEIEEAREKIKQWELAHGGLSYNVMSAPLGRSQMTSEIMTKLGVHP